MTQQLRALLGKLDQLSQRDLLALLGGIVALVVGLEFMLLLPMRDQRLLLTQSLADEASARASAEAALHQVQTQSLASLRQATADQQAELAALGLGADQQDSLAAFLVQMQQQQGVRLVATRGLPVETIDTSTDATDAAVAQASTPDSTAGAATTANTSATLYRHRVELRLEGPVPNLTRALGLIETRPGALRMERLHLSAAEPSGQSVQATVVLTTISEKSTWFAL